MFVEKDEFLMRVWVTQIVMLKVGKHCKWVVDDKLGSVPNVTSKIRLMEMIRVKLM